MSRPITLLACVAGLVVGIAFAVPASAEPAQPIKPKKPVAATAPRVKTNYRGQDKFPAGPVYNGQDYLGDDPDPFIRQQILRDLGLRYGGES